MICFAFKVKQYAGNENLSPSKSLCCVLFVYFFLAELL